MKINTIEPLDFEEVRKAKENDNRVHYCCICHENIVDPYNGEDTCQECLNKK
jgi:hypothetical protein